MTDETDALRAAHWAVSHAKQMDVADGPVKEAQEYWEEAERQYIDAGLDPLWLDHSGLVGELDERRPLMDVFWLFPTDRVEVTFNSESPEVTGIVADMDDLVEVEP